MHRDHKFGSLINDNNDLNIKYEKQSSKNIDKILRNNSLKRND